jgi:DNA-binding MarR family transcriptional regulator
MITPHAPARSGIVAPHNFLHEPHIEDAVTVEQDLAVADAIGSQLHRLMRLVERAQAQYHAEHPDAVERATYHLLVHLVDHGPRRAGALAEAVHSDPSTVSRQIGHLVRLGLVERTADPEDGRATLLAATAEGRRVFAENRRLRNEKIAALVADWPMADRQTLRDLLTRFTDAAELARSRSEPAVAGSARV